MFVRRKGREAKGGGATEAADCYASLDLPAVRVRHDPRELRAPANEAKSVAHGPEISTVSTVFVQVLKMKAGLGCLDLCWSRRS
jgi:hypothetical protein